MYNSSIYYWLLWNLLKILKSIYKYIFIKILHLFPISLGISLIFRSIATIVIISYYNTIKAV